MLYRNNGKWKLLECNRVYNGVYICMGIYRDYTGIMDRKMETTI